MTLYRPRASRLTQWGSCVNDSRAHAGWSVFGIASVGAFLVALDNTLLFAAFHALEKSFPSSSRADLSWVLNGYTVVYAAMLIPGGGLADRYGRKRIFLYGLTAFAAASALCAVSTYVAELVAARALQALGAAMLMPSSLSLVLDAFPKDKRAYVVGIWGAVGALGGTAGPAIGAAIVDAFGWPWAFYMNVPIGLLAAWQGRRLLAEPTPSTIRRPLDWIGMTLLLTGTSGIALAIVQCRALEWSTMRLWIVTGFGMLALAGFAVWIRVAKDPLIDVSLFRNRTFRNANLGGLSFSIAFSMLFLGYFFFLTNIWKYDLHLAGLAVTPGPLAVIPTATITGRLAARDGHRPYLVTGALVFAASAVWFLLMLGPERHFLRDWLPGVVLSGVGVGMVTACISGAAVADLPVAYYGVGSATNQAIRQIGSVMGVAIGIMILSAPVLTHLHFVWLYSVQVFLAMITMLFALTIETRPH